MPMEGGLVGWRGDKAISGYFGLYALFPAMQPAVQLVSILYNWIMDNS